MTENVEQIQACRDALAPEDVLIGDANGGSNMIVFFNTYVLILFVSIFFLLISRLLELNFVLDT